MPLFPGIRDRDVAHVIQQVPQVVAMMMLRKLGLGTVQFGLDYGVSNQGGR